MTRDQAASALRDLERGRPHRFRDWPNVEVPAVAAGAYTVWKDKALLYAGMAGRSLTVESILEHRGDPTKLTGLRSRLASHASGRRSGDQFCVYVADLCVLPSLNSQVIDDIAHRRRSLDESTNAFIHEHLAYRFVVAKDASEARDLERRVRGGALDAGQPHLNPLTAPPRGE